MADGQDGQQEAERWWFEQRVKVVRQEAQAWAPPLYEEGLRLSEIEGNVDQIVRSGILMEARQAQPDGLARLLSRLQSGGTLEAAVRELFGAEVPFGAAIAALKAISFDGREDTDSVDAAVANEIRRPERQSEANHLGPTGYVWQIGVTGPEVLLVVVEGRESAGVLWFRLVHVTDACSLFSAR
jgi:hypothetical protein